MPVSFRRKSKRVLRRLRLWGGTVLLWSAMTTSGLSLTLEDCIRETLIRNPLIQAALMRVEQARCEFVETRSPYLPRVSLTGTYNETDRPSEVFLTGLDRGRFDPEWGPAEVFNGWGKIDSLRLGVEAKFCLFDGGARSSARRKAELQTRYAQEQARAMRNSTFFDVIREYHNVLRAGKILAFKSEMISMLTKNLQEAQDKFSGPQFASSLLWDLESQLAMAREEFPRARKDLELAVAALNAAIGGTVVTDYKVLVSIPVEIPTVPPTKPESATLLTRAEYRMAQIRASMGIEDARRINSKRFPMLNAVGSYVWDGDSFENPSPSYSVTVIAEWPIFAGFSDRSTRSKADLEKLVTAQDVIAVYNRLKLDLERAYSAVEESWQRAREAERSVHNIEEACGVLKQSASPDLSSLLLLARGQVERIAAQIRLTTACHDYLCALADLERASGTLGDRYVNPKAPDSVK
ncbi:MAG: TolC family protein [Kiritimatiellia bacterium]